MQGSTALICRASASVSSPVRWGMCRSNRARWTARSWRMSRASPPLEARWVWYPSGSKMSRRAAQADVVIVGGGIIGLTTAYFLAREGVRVQVLDRGDLGREASWAGAGILPSPGDPGAAASPYEQLRAHSTALMPALAAELC